MIYTQPVSKMPYVHLSQQLLRADHMPFPSVLNCCDELKGNQVAGKYYQGSQIKVNPFWVDSLLG